MVVFAVGSLALLLGSCLKNDEDDDLSYRTTYGYFLKTGNTSMDQTMLIMSGQDLQTFQDQTGAVQTESLGFIGARILDPDGVPLAGVSVNVHGDQGFPVGQVYYQDEATKAYTPFLAQTSGTGRFIAFNIQPGRVNLKCASGADGNLYVHVPSGTSVIAALVATPTKNAVSWTGVTRKLGDTGTALPAGEEFGVKIERLGTNGSVTSGASDGAFNVGSVHANHTWLVKCSKTGFVDTYQYKKTEASTLNGGPDGDLLIVDPTDRDNELVPGSVTLETGTGMIRGIVQNGQGGFTVEARDETGTVQGDVGYGDYSNFGRPGVDVLSTQPDGIYYIYNLPPGRYLLRAVKAGFATSAYVDVFADAVSLPFPLVPEPTFDQDAITLSGSVVTLLNFGAANVQVGIEGLPQGTTSDTFSAYVLQGVPSMHTLIARTLK